MRNLFRHGILAVSCLLLAGCIATFSLVDTGYRPKGKSIAVISGLDSDANVVVAERMTAAFKKHTRFQVVPHKQAASAIPNYPQKIKGPYLFAYFEIDEDYGNTDRKKIQQIQQKLEVDYLYVIWAPTATVTQGTIEQLHCIAQLFEGPSSKEVGHGKFAATAGKVAGCCLVPPPTDTDRSNAVDETTEYVAREIGEKLGMLKNSPAR
jgi:hypothetical protein